MFLFLYYNVYSLSVQEVVVSSGNDGGWRLGNVYGMRLGIKE